LLLHESLRANCGLVGWRYHYRLLRRTGVRMQRSEFCEALKKNAPDIQFIQLQTDDIPESLAEMSR
jgi:hypothetical protein